MKKILIANLVIMLTAIVFCLVQSKEPYQVNLTSEELFNVSGEYREDHKGYYIDETSAYSGCFTCGPYRPLDKGIYTVTVFYETDTDENECYAFSETARYYYGALETDYNKLQSGLTSKSFKIWLNRDMEDFEIRTDYKGKGYLAVREVVIEKSNTTYSFFLLKICFWLGIANVITFLYLAWKKNAYPLENWKVGGGLVLIILVASYPLFYNFLVYGTDLRFHLMRIDGIKEAIRIGQIPVKIAPLWLNGYGFAVSTFYGNLFLYVPAILRLLGMTLQDAYKVYCLFSISIACFTSYYCVKNMFGNKYMGLLGSMLFTLSTYHISMIYSGWTGAYTAYAFLPLIFYGGYLIFTQDVKSEKHKNAWIPMTIGFTGIIQSHLLTCEMVGIFMIICCVIQIRKILKKQVFWALAKTVIMTALVNAWFLIPFLDYMGGDFNIRADRTSDMYNIQSNGIPVANIFSFYQKNIIGGSERIAPYILGPVLLFGVLVFLYYLFSNRPNNKCNKLGLFSFCMGITSLFMCMNIFPWDSLRKMLGPFSSLVGNIEYPWRFLAIVNLFFMITVCVGIMWLKDDGRRQNYIVASLFVLTLFSVQSEYSEMLSVESNFKAYDMEAMDNYDYAGGWGIQQYLPTATDLHLLNAEGPIPQENVEISAYRKTGIDVDFSCVNKTVEAQKIEIPLLNYEGYKAVDAATGSALDLVSSDNHVMQVVLPGEYNGDVKIRFEGMWYWKVSYGISVVTIIGFAIWFVINRVKKK